MLRHARLTLVLLLAGITATCVKAGEDEIDANTAAVVASVAEPATDALLGTLLANLTGAMQEGGPAAAVEFCSTSATELTAGVVREEGLDIKRTSLKYRNPLNAPDEHEIKALRHYESALVETDELPGPWVQKAGRDEYRFYRPLVVAPPCLRCHGPVDEIEPDVRRVLEARYPDDLATGYAAGDFRGVVRVSVPAERVEAASD